MREGKPFWRTFFVGDTIDDAFAWNRVGSALLLADLTLPRGPVRERDAASQRLIV